MGGKITLANPAEQVDWSMCNQLALQNGLVLPTEAQWEYGCRAGTTTPWISTLDRLRLYANLADQTAKKSAPQWGAFEDWTDGHVVHAPVGTFEPNKFGLYDMLGNVWEWCLDEFGDYSGAVRAGDGLRLHGNGSAHRVDRGGSCFDPAAIARSANRGHDAPSFSNFDVGLRLARTVRP